MRSTRPPTTLAPPSAPTAAAHRAAAPGESAVPVEPPQDVLAADVIVDTLVAWGIKDVFICPGSTEAAFLHAAGKSTELEVVLTTHESIAVSMADGLARQTGRPAVAYLHANVGLTNGLSHLYAAQLANSPVVVLTGLKQTQIQSRGGFTTASHPRDFVRQYTKWDWQCLRADDLGYDLSRALQIASTGPQGPTWLGIPQDLAETTVSGAAAAVRGPGQLRVDTRSPGSREGVQRIIELWRNAERPAVVAGADVSRGGTTAIDDLTWLAGRTTTPVFAEDRRNVDRTVLPTTSPAYAGMYDPRRPSIANADLLLFLGARCFIEFEAPRTPEIPAGPRVVHTHPDPDEVAKIYGADVSLVADTGALLGQLVAGLGETEGEGGSRPGRDQFRNGAVAEHRATLEALLTFPETSERVRQNPHPDVSVSAVMRALAETLRPHDLVVGDATTSGKALLHAAEAAGARVMTTNSGSLGWGVGAALGASRGVTGGRVVAVCGDGAFQFGLQGLWTAVRTNANVCFLVVNNASYAAVGAAIRRYRGEVTERERQMVVDLAGPDIAAIARGFGAEGARVELHDLSERLMNAAATPGPTVLEILTDPGDLGP